MSCPFPFRKCNSIDKILNNYFEELLGEYVLLDTFQTDSLENPPVSGSSNPVSFTSFDIMGPFN